MSDNLKIQDTHLRRWAYVYIRQSSATQVLVNRESTQRQYQLGQRAAQLGWPQTQIKVIDEDLAHTGSGLGATHVIGGDPGFSESDNAIVWSGLTALNRAVGRPLKIVLFFSGL